MDETSAAEQYLQDLEALERLDAAGIAVPTTRPARDADEAVAIAEELGWPVEMKLSVPGRLHKSDEGGVALGLTGPADVRATVARFDEIAAGADHTKLVQKQTADGGIDLLVSVRRIPVLGQFVTIGQGGVWTELFADTVTLHGTPDAAAVSAALGRLKAAPLLDGYRGAEPYDVTLIGEMIARIAAFADASSQEFDEIELNPIRAFPTDPPVALDVTIRRRADTGESTQPVLSGSDDRAWIEALLRPRSIAVVGASDVPTKPGARLVRHLEDLGYDGDLHLINRRLAREDARYHASLEAVDADIDMAIIATPAGAVPDVVLECGRRDIPVAVVLAGGFAEVGDYALEARLEAAITESGVRVLGPNTTGVISTAVNTFPSFSLALDAVDYVPGAVAMLTQSGGVAVSFLCMAWESGIGISYCVVMGNETDIKLTDALVAVGTSEPTRVVCVFLEELTDWDAFAHGVRELASKGIYVVVYKAGRTEIGGEAVASHSARIVKPYHYYDAALQQLGVVTAPNPSTMLDASHALAISEPAKGPRIAVASVSGGACAIAADGLFEAGLEVPRLTEETQAQLRELLPLSPFPRNPVDLTGEALTRPQLVPDGILAILRDPNVDACLAVLHISEEGCPLVQQGLIDAVKETGKPLVLCWTLGDATRRAWMPDLEANGIVVFGSIERCIVAVDALVQAGRKVPVSNS